LIQKIAGATGASIVRARNSKPAEQVSTLTVVLADMSGKSNCAGDAGRVSVDNRGLTGLGEVEMEGCDAYGGAERGECDRDPFASGGPQCRDPNMHKAL